MRQEHTSISDVSSWRNFSAISLACWRIPPAPRWFPLCSNMYRSHVVAGSWAGLSLSVHFLSSLISSLLSFSGSTTFLGFLGFSSAALALGLALALSLDLVSVALD